MTDTALSNAEKRLTYVEERIENIETELKALEIEKREMLEERRRVRAFISAWHDFMDTDPAKLRGTVVGYHQAEFEMPQKAGVKNNPKKEEVAEAARSIILDAGRPIPRGDLLEALGKRGITLYGKDPAKVLSTMLWRMSDVIENTPLGYWVAGRPVPAQFAVRGPVSD